MTTKTKTWQVGKTYGFTPSGDANELTIKIVRKATDKEAQAWWNRTYHRPVQSDEGSGQAYQAVVVTGGFDADIRHFPNEEYYVYTSDFDPSQGYHQGV